MRALLCATLVALVGCARATQPPPCEDTTEPPVPAADVCAHLDALGCDFQESVDAALVSDPVSACLAGYSEWTALVPVPEFARLTHCYLRATTCELVDGCNRTCGEGGGSVHSGDAGAPPDADASSDLGASDDAGALDDGASG
jgi:hypothetical protein